MSRGGGAGREHSQAESQAGQWRYSVPWTSCSVYGWGLARGQESFFLVSMSSNLLLVGSSNFSRSSVFLLQEFREIHDFQVLALLVGGLTTNQSLGGRNMFVYCV